MTCEQLKDEYELHALGLLEAPERWEIDQHLRSGCPTCKAGMRRAVMTNVTILQLVPDLAPPSKLRKRVISSVGVERRNWTWVTMWVTAMAAMVLTVVWVGMQDRRNALDTTEARQTLAILNEPETKQVSFGNTTPQPPHGRIFVNSRHGVLLLASNLPPASAGKAFELWVIPKAGNPKPSGVFKADSRGTAMYLSKAPVDLAQAAAVAVTVEVEAGVPAPTSTPIIVAPLAE
jgi:anti-sigma-K factor RskA